jgi:hypothetical protein
MGGMQHGNHRHAVMYPQAFHRSYWADPAKCDRQLVTLRPRPEIILLLDVDEPGTAEAAGKLNIRHIPTLGRSELGTPLLSSAFSLAHREASADVLCYVNADITFFRGLC